MIEYNLYEKSKEGFIYMEIMQGMYGLPQASILANKLLKKRLKPHGYYEVKHIPGFFKHQSNLPLSSTIAESNMSKKKIQIIVSTR